MSTDDIIYLRLITNINSLHFKETQIFPWIKAQILLISCPIVYLTCTAANHIWIDYNLY